jgi:hypothetical protein
MIEYVFQFYGIFCHNKCIGYLATGLTLSVFSGAIIAVKLFESFKSNTSEFLLKLLLIILFVTKVVNLLIIKYKSSKLIELNNKLKKFQNKSRINQNFLNIFSIISILFSLLMAFIGTKIYFWELCDTEIFKGFDGQLELIPMPSIIKFFVMHFYLSSWYVSIQLLYIEFKTRYISIIKEFRKEVLNEKSEPDGDVLKLTQKFVLKFVNFKNEIKSNIDFLKIGISIEFFLSIGLIIFLNGFVMESKFYRLNILRIVLMIGYYLWTMSSNLRIRIVENNLSFILNRWLNLKVEDSIRIDMDYIQTFNKQYNEKESNSEPIEL